MRSLPLLATSFFSLILASCAASPPRVGHAATAPELPPATAVAPTSKASTPAVEAGQRGAKVRPRLKPAAELESPPKLASKSQPKGAEVEKCALPEEGPAVGFYVRDERPEGQVALTFDDGPHPGKTPKVLNLLRKHKMHAAFFVVGAAIRPDTYQLIQRMVAEGHVIGTHSYNHDIKMASRRPGRRTVEYVRGQHEVTRILIDLALMAQSKQDFIRLYRRVFERKHVVYMPAGKMRHWPTFFARHRLLLSEAGYQGETRPYDVLYSRPPGGGPYLEPSQKWQRELNDTALREAGLANVMWHDESGDTNAEKKRDFGFLTSNLRRGFKRGGVVLIHDYIRTDALTAALTALAKSKTKVVPLAQMVAHKYGCSEETLRAQLRPASKSTTKTAVARASK